MLGVIPAMDPAECNPEGPKYPTIGYIGFPIFGSVTMVLGGYCTWALGPFG